MGVVNDKRGILNPYLILPKFMILIFICILIFAVFTYVISMEVEYQSDETLRLGQDVVYRLAGSDECLAYKDPTGKVNRFVLDDSKLTNLEIINDNSKPACAEIPSFIIHKKSIGGAFVKGIGYAYTVEVIDAEDASNKWTFGDKRVVIKDSSNNGEENTFELKTAGPLSPIVTGLTESIVPVNVGIKFVQKYRNVQLPIAIHYADTDRIHTGIMYLTLYTFDVKEGTDWHIGEKQLESVIGGGSSLLKVIWGVGETVGNIICIW